MRLWTALICTVIALQSMVVRSETWSCSYTLGDEQKVFVRMRVDGGFTNPASPSSNPHTILLENDLVIHTYDFDGNDGMYFATLLNKENKRFSMVGLGTSFSTHIIEGPCEIY